MTLPVSSRQRHVEIRPKPDEKSPPTSADSGVYKREHPELPTLIWSPGQHHSTIEYDWMTACHGWVARLRRTWTTERSIVKRLPYSDENWFFSHPDAMKPAIILSSLATTLKKEDPTLTGYADPDMQLDVARRLKLYKYYNGLAISSLSRDVKNPDLYMSKMVLRRLANLLVGEMALRSPSLPLHLKGFAAMVQTRGGVRKVMERQELVGQGINAFMVITTIINTTSPARDHLPTECYIVNDDAYLLYTTAFVDSFPCPTQLYRCLVDINWLRAQTVSRERDDKMIRAAAAVILASIQSFKPENWTERPQLCSPEVRLLLAQIYQSATELYLRLSLSEHMSHPLSPSQRFAKAELTTTLAERLQAHCGYHLSAAWPLTVAAAALGGGPVAQQVTLDRHLRATSDLYSSSRGVSVTLQCLRKFWASGKTGWEDCFTEWQHSS